MTRDDDIPLFATILAALIHRYGGSVEVTQAEIDAVAGSKDTRMVHRGFYFQVSPQKGTITVSLDSSDAPVVAA